MSPKNDDHVVIGGENFECRHCGATEEVGLPLGLSDLESVSMSFLTKHSSCEADTAMKTYKFYGGGDDTIYVETHLADGSSSRDEYGFKGSEDLAKFNIGNLMTIYAFYDGTWAFGVGQWVENTHLPDWPVRIMGSTGYTTHLEVDVPGGMPFEQVTGEE